MKKIFGAVLAFAGFSATCVSASAATLDDVMARLDSLQRDNQAMRKEIATLRQEKVRSSASQPVITQGAPSRSLSPAVSTAMAADLPARGYYKAVPVSGPYNWSGVYAGLNAGYGSGNETTTLDFGPTTITSSRGYGGFLGGAQIGYNFQFSNLLLGVEADIQSANIGGTFHPIVLGVYGTNTLDAFGTVRGRVGLAFDRFLVYGTGGFAAGRNTFQLIQVGTATESGIHTGWAAGAGLEYGIGENWSVKAEYLRINLEEHTYFAGAPNGVTYRPSMDFDLVRAGVNYRF